MAWSAPMTAVANTIFTAAQFNQYVRDNLNETAPAKVTAISRYLVSTGTNAITQRECFQGDVATAETTTSTSYTDLATAGPSVSVSTGSKALVFVSCGLESNTTNATCNAGYAISGATVVAATDNQSVQLDGVTGANGLRYGIVSLASGLATGVNVFTMKYKVGSNTGTFRQRSIAVLPF